MTSSTVGCDITADQAGDADFPPAASVTRSFTITGSVPSAPFITSLSAANGSITVSIRDRP